MARLASHRIDWLNSDLLCWQPAIGNDMLSLMDGIEDVTIENQSGRPVRYIFDFSSHGLALAAEDARELAEFLLELTAAPSAIAIVSLDAETDIEAEQIFTGVLRAGGFEVQSFETAAEAEIWLHRFTSTCADEGRTCGPDCDQALTQACPALSRLRLN